MVLVLLHFWLYFLLLVFVEIQALDLKPNYVRAWANMGISYANQVCSYSSLKLTIIVSFRPDFACFLLSFGFCESWVWNCAIAACWFGLHLQDHQPNYLNH